MSDVARLAGVSAQTVSRTLSGHPHVQPDTRARVLAAVEQLGYRRNSAARALSSGRSRTLGVVTLQTGFASRIALTVGVETAAARAGYAVSSVTTPSLDADAIESALSRLADREVEGIVLAVPLVTTNAAIEELTRLVPTVATDGSRTPSTEVLTIDQSAIGALATRHLLELGHRTVWHVSGPEEWRDAAGREQGWRDELAAAGIQPPPVLPGDWSPESGYRNGLILARVPDATAVFVASDEMAFGVIRALHEQGRSVPGDVSIVGVDDIPLAAYCSPALTTIAQPFTEVGRLAVEHLLATIGTAHDASRRRSPTDDAAPAAAPSLIIEPTLIVRDSTATPTASAD